MGAYKASDFERVPTYYFDEGFGYGAEHTKIITTREGQPSIDNMRIYDNIKEHNRRMLLKSYAYYLHVFLVAIRSDLRQYENGDKARLRMARHASGHAIEKIEQIIKEYG